MKGTYVSLGLLLTAVALAAPSLAVVELVDQVAAFGQGSATTVLVAANDVADSGQRVGGSIADNAAATAGNIVALELAAVDGFCGLPMPMQIQAVEALDQAVASAQAYADWAQAAPDCLLAA